MHRTRSLTHSHTVAGIFVANGSTQTYRNRDDKTYSTEQIPYDHRIYKHIKRSPTKCRQKICMLFGFFQLKAFSLRSHQRQQWKFNRVPEDFCRIFAISVGGIFFIFVFFFLLISSWKADKQLRHRSQSRLPESIWTGCCGLTVVTLCIQSLFLLFFSNSEYFPSGAQKKKCSMHCWQHTKWRKIHEGEWNHVEKP